MKHMSFDDCLRFGAEAEKMVARVLLERGVTLAPLYQFDNHGSPPIMLWEEEHQTHRHSLPDMYCFSEKNGCKHVWWAEVKRQRQWVRYTSTLETGFKIRQLENYCEIEDKTGKLIWVFFVHEQEDPTGIYYQKLPILVRRVREWNGRKPNREKVTEPLALFPIDCLHRLCDLPADWNCQSTAASGHLVDLPSGRPG